MKRLFFGILGLCLAALNLAMPMAVAQSISGSGFAASISPLPILLDVKPGNSVSTDLRVQNPSAHAEKFKVVLKTFTQDGPNGTVNLHDPTPSDSFLNWVSFDRTTFDAPPGLWQTVRMTIDVPKEATFGYYFAVEFTSANQTGQTSGTGTAIQGAVASFVLLNAESPGETKQLQVTSFTADHRFYQFLPVNFTIKLHNSGNIFAGASGNIFIMRGGKQVASLTVNPNHGLVLPGSNRLFYDSWQSGFPVYQNVFGSNGQPLEDSNGNLKTRLSWNFGQISHLRFGHYTAQLALVYNNGTRDIPINGSLSFWVVPWSLILAVIIIITAPAITVYIIMKRRFRKRLEKERAKLNAADK